MYRNKNYPILFEVEVPNSLSSPFTQAEHGSEVSIRDPAVASLILDLDEGFDVYDNDGNGLITFAEFMSNHMQIMQRSGKLEL